MKFSALSLAITSALAVTACGGGGGGGSDNPPNPPAPEKITQNINYTGYSASDAAIAADLVDYANLETVICYDLNANDSCDNDEPKNTVRGISGQATLEVDKNTDLSNVNILAINNNYVFKLPVNAGDSASTVSDSSRSDANVNALTNMAYSQKTGSGPISGPSELAGIIGGDESKYQANFNARNWDDDTALMADILLALGYGKTYNNKLNKNTSVSDLVNSIGNLYQTTQNRCASLTESQIIANVIADGENALANLNVCPTITIKAGFTSVVDGATVSFTDHTTTSKDNYEDLVYSWNFGDDETSSEINPTHTYKASGDYNVTLIVKDKNSTATDTYVQTVSVVVPENHKPVASYTADLNGLTVKFSNKSTDADPEDKDNLTYVWNFGDGEISNEANPTHTYTTAGNYTVTLIAKDTKGLESVPFTSNVKVAEPAPNPYPEFKFTVDGLKVKFQNLSSDPDEDQLFYTWEFGDGSTSSEEDPVHEYAQSGEYIVVLTVSDGKVSNSFRSNVVVAVNNPPVAKFTSKVDGNTVKFTNESTDADGDELTYSWDFGDGNTSTDKNPSHTYEVKGEYTVVLTVTDAKKATDSYSRNVSLSNNAPVASYTSEVDGKTVKFTDKSTDADGDELTYSWNFGDGNTSTDKNPSHTYESNGKYTVELTVSDGQDSDTFSKEFNIGSNNPPVASFTSKADGKTVKFTNNSSDPDGDELTYSWDFGDGKTSTDENPSHEYATSGKYTVTLTVSDGDLKNEKTATVNIAPGPDGRICPESDPYCNGSSVIQCAEVCTTEQKEICTGDDVVVSGAISDDYHATNPGGKVGVNKTISSMSDWTSEMLVAQSAANDDPRAYYGYHEKATDIYAIYAAWDDNNLYLMAEFPNLENKETGGDFDYTNDQFLPMGIAINTGKRKAGDGSMVASSSDAVPWVKSKDESYSIKAGIDTLVMFHPRTTIGKPSIFLTNDEGLFSYDADYCIGFDEAGITRSGGIEGTVSAKYMGIADNYKHDGDAWKTETYTDLKASNDAGGHLYQVTIPLASMGIDKNYLENHGIGVMFFSTFGTSIMDAVPWDPVLVDNASKEYSKDPSTSHEKEDFDLITVPLASVGKLQGTSSASTSDKQCHFEDVPVCVPAEGCTPDEPITLNLGYTSDDAEDSVTVTATVETGFNDVKYTWKPSTGSASTTEYNETTKSFTVKKGTTAKTFTLEVTATSENGARTGSKTITVDIPACSGSSCVVPPPSEWGESTGEYKTIPEPSDCKAPENSVILKYDGFTNPYIWLYDDKNNYSGGTWPGAAMTKVDGCTESFYSFTPATSVSSASAIFSDAGGNQYPGQQQPGVAYTPAAPCFDFAKKEFVSAESCGMTPEVLTTGTYAELDGSVLADGATISIIENDENPKSKYKDIAFFIKGEGVDANTTGTYTIDGVEGTFKNGEVFRIGEKIVAADTAAGEEPKTAQLVIAYGNVKSTYTISKKKKVIAPPSEVKFSWDNVLIYFVMTDRFENGDTSNDNSYGRPKTDAAGHSAATFHGGDIKGMTKRLDYLKSLGMNAVWITAPYEQSHGWTGGGKTGNFQHYAYHGYYALDFTALDANMGTVDEFRTFVTEAHKRGIRVVLDIVMNHSGYATLKDMCDYGFGVRSDGKGACEEWTPGDGQSFHSKPIDESRNTAWDSWWGSSWLIFGGYGDQCGAGDGLDACVSYLPDFKNSNPHSPSVGVPTFLTQKWSKDDAAHDIPAAKQYRSGNMSVAEFQAHWLASWVEEFGIDGFRCDTAKHVTKPTWKLLKEYSQEALQKWRQAHANGDDPAASWTDNFWMTGESWGFGTDPTDGSGYGSAGGFDSMINFKFNMNAGGQCSVPSMDSWNSYAKDYGLGSGSPKLNALTYVSSHDTSLCRPSDMKNLGTMLVLLPGGVQVFYGDETGRPNDNGGSANDAEHGTRSDMNFPSDIDNQAEWAANVDTLSTSFSSNETLAHWQKVGQFRFRNPAVGAGKQTATSDGSLCRKYTDGDYENAVVIHVGSASSVNVGDCFSDGDTVVDAYSGNSGTVSGGSVSIAGTGNLILLETARQ
ncbi:MAG: PKD domain-containing protein [Ruminobacter sp.]|nr:PKD domain-containing protein [Ruminobacter sp.]